MPLYHFETTWRLRAPLAAVWRAVVDSERWPEWWRGVECVELLQAGDEWGIGARHRLTWRSKLPYTLSFDAEIVRVEPMSLIEGRATGELEGSGIWRFAEQDGVTTLVCNLTFVSKKARDGAVATGMTDGLEHSYARLDDMFLAAA